MSKESSGTNYSWFTSVEVEVNARCNRRCSYCPVSVLPTPPAGKIMTEELFDRILAELVRIGFKGNLSYHRYNEPLLRKDLETLVTKAKALLPAAFQLLFTNGDLLTDERYESLRRAGIDHFVVTRHDLTPIQERHNQTVQFPSDLVIINRGGFFKPLTEALRSPCYAPTDTLTITVDGDVLLCCNDAEGSQVMGNVAREGIDDIWLSPQFTRIRRLLQKGNRQDAADICRKCDDLEYFGPGEHRNEHLRKEVQG
jgi:GTP 3',8-cyclase